MIGRPRPSGQEVHAKRGTQPLYAMIKVPSKKRNGRQAPVTPSAVCAARPLRPRRRRRWAALARCFWRGLSLPFLLAATIASASQPATRPTDVTQAAVDPVYFVVVAYQERYIIQLTDPVKIDAARKMMTGAIPTPGWILGRLAEGDGGYNRDFGSGRQWTWHLVPDSIDFVEITAEALQTLPSGIEDDKPYWFGNMNGACAIDGRIESEGLVFRPGQFINQSARSRVGAGTEVQIAGFVIAGNGPETVLIRAAGPALTPLGVGDALADPSIELRDQRTGALLGSNDNWSDNAAEASRLETTAARVGAFPWTRGSADSALLVTLNPGPYTAIVRGKNGGTGISLIEVYRADDPTRTRLVNVSVRSQTGSGANVPIGGFVLSGVQRKTVLIRVAGPALAASGVSNPLADPTVTIHDQRSKAIVGSNDNWDQQSAGDAESTPEAIEAATRSIGATPFPRGTKDAALLLTLEPGAYTAVVQGVNNAQGVSLLEVFELAETPAIK